MKAVSSEIQLFNQTTVSLGLFIITDSGKNKIAVVVF